MANFCSYPQGDEISEVTLPNAMDKGAPKVRIGLWGYLDTISPGDANGKELVIQADPYVTVTKGDIKVTNKGSVRVYELSSYHPGRWNLEAVPQGGGDPWDKLTVIVQHHLDCQGTFPQDVIAAAQAANTAWNIPASITLAQWAIESRWGQDMPSGSNNPFGIKAGAGQRSVKAPTLEFINGKYVSVMGTFRVFASINEAFDLHGRLLATDAHYAQARTLVNDPDAFADALTGVYATDPVYGTKLKKMMKNCYLYQYD
jgi:Mannosyl-glycoprotein endo-beta-N-acetylglucosaminidase